MHHGGTENTENQNHDRAHNQIVFLLHALRASVVYLFFFLPISVPPRALAQDAPAAFDPTFAAWGRVLARCATPDGFRYSELVADYTDMNRELTELASVTREQFDRFPRPLQLAFLINAHNIHAVDRVARRYPVASIEKTSLLGSALKRRRIALLGRNWSLLGLREEIMGPRFRDSRAVFALDWAMKGCAPLAAAPATETNLHDLLERQTSRFMQDARYHRYDRVNFEFFASPLVKQYRREIERDYTTLWGFLTHFATPDEASGIKARAPKIKSLPFDRSLNDAPVAAAPQPSGR